MFPVIHKPLREEIENCNLYLQEELEIMKNLKTIVALGKIAFDSLKYALNASGYNTHGWKFSNGSFYQFGEKRVFCLFHPSPRNVNTGRISRNRFIEIGKKNRNNQLSLNETTKKIEEALTLEPDLIIIEGRETGIGVEIYDGEGNIKWDWVEEIMDSCPRNRLLFEAPMEKQQTELILHLGNDINLGNVSVESVAAVASERLGFRGDTFGIQSSVKNFSGSPSAKFVYHVIKNAISSDQAMIIQITGLSRRTIQNALDELLKSGKIREHADPSDLRRKIYSVIQ